MENTLDKAIAIIGENERIIANILHDVKSPLYSIKIALQNRLENELNRDIFETAADTIEYIENFLINYSFKTGKLEAKVTPCDIKKIIEKKIENYKYIFINKNIHLDIVISEENYIINSIEAFLSSILGNIISNIALHASANDNAVITITRRANCILVDFKNTYDKTNSDFSLGLDFCTKLSKAANISLKFSKTKDTVLVNLKIPELNKGLKSHIISI